jgi:hypothetical protein
MSGHENVRWPFEVVPGRGLGVNEFPQYIHNVTNSPPVLPAKLPAAGCSLKRDFCQGVYRVTMIRPARFAVVRPSVFF